jgi:hypothetical protein
MSYCRCMTKGSEVYIYKDIDGYLSISFCVGRPSINEKLEKHKLQEEYQYTSREDAITFLENIKLLGFLVPDQVFERLQMETW